MKTIKLYLLLLAILTALPISLQAQLKKTANVEKVKSFTNGSVTLFKTTTASGGVVYSVTLRNNSKYLDDIVLFLGNKEDMIKKEKRVTTLIFLQMEVITILHLIKYWDKSVLELVSLIVLLTTTVGFLRRL